MKNIIILFFLFAPFCNLIFSQNYASFSDSILKENLQKDISFFCDPGLSGRKIGSAGEKKVSNYIRNQFIKYGLTDFSNQKSSYFQNFSLSYDSLLNFKIYNNKASLNYISDFFTWEFCFLHDTSDIELVYAGFGLDRDDYSDYKNINVKNKWVVVEINSPIDSTGKLSNHFDFNKPINIPEINEKKQIAQNHGASGIIFKINSQQYVPELFSKLTMNWHTYRSKDNIALNMTIGTYPGINAKNDKVDSLMGLNSDKFDTLINSMLKNKQSPAGIASARVSFKVDKKIIKFDSQNIIGIIKGKDEKVGIIISAHYDAVKGDDILPYPAANDNASGTAAVIQLSKAFSEMAKAGYVPEKSIAFVLFSGEEDGIVGSSYFLKHIPFNMDTSTLDINLDCIGILDTSRFRKGGLNVAAPEDVINRYRNTISKIALNEQTALKVDFNQYFQYSDNASFTYNGYPAMHISTGGGEVIHSPQDKPELFNYNNLVNVARLVFDFVVSTNYK